MESPFSVNSLFSEEMANARKKLMFFL